jgi:phage baseplate assembly protein W
VNDRIVGRGLAFPIKPSIGGRLPAVTGDEKIRQGIALVLETAVNERQMRPAFGCGIHDLVFEANTELLRNTVQDKARRALTRWEPRIDVLDVRVETPAEARNYLLIRIDYRVRANNAFYNLVYPFFLSEGNQ